MPENQRSEFGLYPMPITRCARRSLTAMRFASLCLFIGISPTSWAISFITFDARSVSMGGTGVATARSHNASLFNPALLIESNPARAKRVHLHAYTGARVIDRNQFIKTAKAFSDRYSDGDPAEWLGTQMDLTPSMEVSGGQLRHTSGALRTLQADANQLANKPLRASGSYGIAFSYPQEHWAIGGYHRQFLVLGSILRIADEDNANVDRISETIDLLANLVDDVVQLIRDAPRDEASAIKLTLEEVALLAEPVLHSVRALELHVNVEALQNDILERSISRDPRDYLSEPLPDQLASTIESQGAEVTEQALSLARNFHHSILAEPLTLGLTVKQVHFTSVHYSQPLAEFSLSAYQAEEHRRSDDRLNVDVGLLQQLHPRWQVGLVVRNLISYEVTTALGQELVMRPIARLGIGYAQGPWRLSLDLDITRNEPLGFDPDKQYLGVGVELFAWRNTAVRAGVRTNLVDGETLPSIGLGMGGRHSHLDIAVAHSLNGDELGVAMQAGFSLNP